MVSIVSSVFPIHIANAETHITGGHLSEGAYWDISGSPYIIEDTVTIRSSESLTIGPGVTIVGAENMQGYLLLDVRGHLYINGEDDNRVKVTGQGSVFSNYGTSSIANTDISISDGVYLSGGLTTISSSTISSSTYGIYAKQSDILVTNSRIYGNTYGVYVKKPNQQVFQVRGNDDLNGRGGIGNALDDGTVLPKIVITGSSIIGNTVAAVYNTDTGVVHATGNWWGDKDGPVSSGINKIFGPVEYSPWLDKDPSEKVVCCSSVLFIPGLEGTRLYRSQSLPLGLGSISNRLWEPLSNADVKGLYLGQDGSSVDKSIYSDEPIDSALGLKGVYGRFIDNLKGLMSAGAIVEWKSFGYDWRKSIAEVVAGPEKRATTTESLIDTVTELAARSKTGKVTIVAHSNGGLVAKYLVKVLDGLGKASLIDNVISVAVPYLGTPQAIMGLLHGSDQSVALGLIVREVVARGLGGNMASAYSLLPSAEYFSNVFGPVVTFASTTVVGVNNGKYPSSISGYSVQKQFILGSGDARVSATSSDTSRPIYGNGYLMNAAETVHNTIDLFNWPQNIATWAIVGWNEVTAAGVKYSEKRKCLKSLIGMTCDPQPAHEKIASKMGDGTVMAGSAQYGASTTLALDLQTISIAENGHFSHSNILESSSTIGLINGIIKSGAGENAGNVGLSTSTLGVVSNSPVFSSGTLPAGVTVGRVPTSDGSRDTYLTVSTHSPVDLHIYDSHGNHTGAIDPPTGTEEVYYAYETNIPGSDYTKSDEGDTYVDLPDDGQKYNVVVSGNGVGEFTLDVERKNGANTLQSIEYSMIPTNPLTIASTTVESGGGISGGGSLGGSGGGAGGNGDGNVVVSPLIIDEDGDGTVDATTTANKPFDPITYLEMYKKTINSIAGSTLRGKLLIVRINILEALIKSGKLKAAKNLASRTDKVMNHVKFKKLNTSDRDNILNMFDVFLKQFE